jgi:hypothetical protein
MDLVHVVTKAEAKAVKRSLKAANALSKSGIRELEVRALVESRLSWVAVLKDDS